MGIFGGLGTPVEHMLANGADVNLACEAATGRTALNLAVNLGGPRGGGCFL